MNLLGQNLHGIAFPQHSCIFRYFFEYCIILKIGHCFPPNPLIITEVGSSSLVIGTALDSDAKTDEEAFVDINPKLR